MLWTAAVALGFAAPIWMTFRQAKELGGFVRKGEKGSPVVYASTVTRTELDDETGEETERDIPFMKAYTVFNVEQIDGLPAHYYAKAEPRFDPPARIQHAEDFFAALGADVRHGGNQAYYAVTLDYIQMPPFEAFRDAETYYATLAHEHCHLTRHPAMRAIIGREGLERHAASSSQMGRLETEWLASDVNLATLTALSGAWIDQIHARKPPHDIVLDMDSSESPTHGRQEGAAWNGHFGCNCYHPLFVFNQFGDLERSLLRPGHVHSAADWRLVLEPVITRYRERGINLYFRADAAFAKPEIYERLEQEGIQYAIRLPANDVLQRRIGHLLTRPVGRPPKKPIISFASFRYQAKSWTRPRRVVARVEWHQGELYPRVGFIVTNLSRPSERVVKFYNGRGTAEQWIKEGKNALRWTRLSCRAFRHNAVRLQLHALAYNIANFLRTLALPKEIEQWSLTTLREKLVKIGARIVRHGRYVVFQLAEVAVPRVLFAKILRRIDGPQLRSPPFPA